MTPDVSVARLDDLFAALAETPAGQDLLRRVERGGAFSVEGLARSAQHFLAALLHGQAPGRVVVLVTDGLKAQESAQQDLETWFSAADGAAGSARPLFYPAWEVLPHESKLPHADVISERLETLGMLRHYRQGSGGRGLVIATSVTALLQRTFTSAYLTEHSRGLSPGDQLDPLDLIEWLEDQGYEPEAQVTQKGEIALRGGILDVFPLTSPWPVRLEFFGDELESLRHFDPTTQISREPIDRVELPPAGELGLLRHAFRRREEDGTVQEAPRPELATLLDHLPDRALIVLAEPDLLAEQAASYAAQVPAEDPFFVAWPEVLEAAGLRGFTVLSCGPGDPDASERVAMALPSLEAFRPVVAQVPDPTVAEQQRREFFGQLHRWLRQDHFIHVFCNNEGERDRFQEVWREYGLADPADQSALNARLVIRLGSLSRGFLSEEARRVVVTDAEIFGRYKVQRPRRLKSSHAVAARSALDINFAELEEGDYVVHLQYGIGRYLGLKPLPTVTRRRDSVSIEPAPVQAHGPECLVIEYAPSDPEQPPPKLYVPVTEAHLVSKYVGAGKARPPLNTLSGTRWAKTRAQAELAVRDLAADLLEIQAARASQEGHSFPPDVPWQREFEASFLFEETADQWTAIRETKTDMETPRPMDRLICGDVGFGKTEVAIRAAFKAVMGGRQVAVLVPTTVLAQQHFNTFRERMADYPVRVELLSRFRSRREQDGVVRDLASGSVDIVVGTHRLVQDDIVFKDLGLVVIDEEQRFGVLHKEKFKRLRRLVDVLTLSATPIPRTLYLALTGARDMSTIQTPPHDRLPVETNVAPYDERVIRDAIQRELNRGGQVFFLHNRVTTIETVAQRLRTLVPAARIVVGHGQMKSHELEEVMTAFVNGEADVLLSTTIIESGLDIPNANTIIIDRADRFGLSDLYQLRGRVGRYKHQAYAYLLLPRHAGLLSDARRRISAIKQYSTLGSGFKIAMRDLEIRGAGNLLGAQQSGHITAVGFELYCQLLKQSVSALKGEKVTRRLEVQVRLDFLALHPGEESSGAAPAPKRHRPEPELNVQVPREVATWVSEPDSGANCDKPRGPVTKAPAYVPVNYVPEAQHRIDVYRKLAQASALPDVKAVEGELRDRFGPIPPAVELLLLVTELKLLASALGITGIESKDDRLMLTRNRDYVMVGGKFPRLTKRQARARLGEIRRFLMALETGVSKGGPAA